MLRASLADLGPDLCRKFAEQRFGSFTFTGPTGRGKSWAAAAWFLDKLLKHAQRVQKLVRTGDGFLIRQGNPHWDIAAAWLTVPVWLRRLRQAMNDGALDEDETVEAVAGADWVVLDDVGAEKQSDWTSEIIYQVVAEREGNALPTIVTTNLSISDLSQVHQRLASRIGGFTVIVFGGPDRRLRKETTA